MTEDTRLAATLAAATGELLMRLRAQWQGMGAARRAESAPDRGALGGVADRRAQEFLASELARERPGDLILSEEAAAPAARRSAPRLWIIDPLDGTREYVAGGEDFAVHLALVSAGVVVAAAVGLPALGQVVTSRPPVRRPRAIAPEAPVVVSRTRCPPFAAAVARALEADLETVGSAGYKVWRVLSGSARAYVHAGGINEWDVAAPAGVALAAGLAVTDLRGRPLQFNQPDTVLREGLIVCWPEDHKRILDAVASAP